MLEILTALLVGYLFGRMKQEKAPLVLAYQTRALQLGFRHKRLFNNWQAHNQTLANHLVSELAGRKVDEIDKDWITERLNSLSKESTEHALAIDNIEKLYAVGGLMGGDVSLRSLGLQLLDNAFDKAVIENAGFYKQLFADMKKFDDTPNFTEPITQPLTVEQVAESKLYELGRLGLVLNIAARYEGKVNW